MSTRQFTLPGSTITLPTGNAFIVLATVVAVGTLTCFAFLLAAVLLAASLLNLAPGAVCELTAHLAVIYTSSYALGKLLIWLVVLYLALKLWPHLVRSLRGALAAR